ncbi:MAG: hypothetical protein EZS28_010162 [Streblomastix strix]|uniref:Cation efflux protein cytoplasmic domain-containing protein n=1 Tax=Streblomastix strix TaxID=222440 RepID=A0A5J4WH07_9EUKA|nr:MAG: hypothetical protein EZS28_010162 [Streblomastix strix]
MNISPPDIEQRRALRAQMFQGETYQNQNRSNREVEFSLQRRDLRLQALEATQQVNSIPFLKLDIISILSRSLDSANKDIVEETLWTMSNMAAGQSYDTRAIAFSDAFEKIIKFMDSPEKKIAMQAIWCMSNICGDNVELLNFCLDKEIFPKALLILNNSLNSKSEMLIRQSVFLITNLLRCNKTLKQDMIIRGQSGKEQNLSDIVSPLCNAFQYFDVNSIRDFQTIRDIIQALGYLLIRNDQLVEIIYPLNIISMIADAAKKNDNYMKDAIYVLSFFASGKDEMTKAVYDLDILDVLVKLLKKNDFSCVQDSLFTISNICTINSVEVIQTILNSEIPIILAQILPLKQTNYFILCREALWCVNNIVTQENIDYSSLILANVPVALTQFLKQLLQFTPSKKEGIIKSKHKNVYIGKKQENLTLVVLNCLQKLLKYGVTMMEERFTRSVGLSPNHLSLEERKWAMKGWPCCMQVKKQENNSGPVIFMNKAFHQLRVDDDAIDILIYRIIKDEDEDDEQIETDHEALLEQQAYLYGEVLGGNLNKDDPVSENVEEEDDNGRNKAAEFSNEQMQENESNQGLDILTQDDLHLRFVISEPVKANYDLIKMQHIPRVFFAIIHVVVSLGSIIYSLISAKCLYEFFSQRVLISGAILFYCIFCKISEGDSSGKFSFGRQRFAQLGGFIATMSLISALFFMLLDIMNAFIEAGDNEHDSVLVGDWSTIFYIILSAIVLDVFGFMLFFNNSLINLFKKNKGINISLEEENQVNPNLQLSNTDVPSVDHPTVFSPNLNFDSSSSQYQCEQNNSNKYIRVTFKENPHRNKLASCDCCNSEVATGIFSDSGELVMGAQKLHELATKQCSACGCSECNDPLLQQDSKLKKQKKEKIDEDEESNLMKQNKHKHSHDHKHKHKHNISAIKQSPHPLHSFHIHNHQDTEIMKKLLIEGEDEQTLNEIGDQEKMLQHRENEDTEEELEGKEMKELADIQNDKQDEIKDDSQTIGNSSSLSLSSHTNSSYSQSSNENESHQQGQKKQGIGLGTKECVFYDKEREIDFAPSSVLVLLLGDISILVLQGISASLHSFYLRDIALNGNTEQIERATKIVENYELYGYNIILLIISIFFILLGVRLIWRISLVLLLGLPKSISSQHIRRVILSAPGVLSVHELHIWGLGLREATAQFHIVMARSKAGYETDFIVGVLYYLSAELHKHGVHTFTVQPEFVNPSEIHFHKLIEQKDDVDKNPNSDQSNQTSPTLNTGQNETPQHETLPQIPKLICFTPCDKQCVSSQCCTVSADLSSFVSTGLNAPKQ